MSSLSRADRLACLPAMNNNNNNNNNSHNNNNHNTNFTKRHNAVSLEPMLDVPLSRR